jgi:hypothetical protein
MTLLKNRSLGLAVINFGAKTLKLCLAVMVCGLMIGVGGVVGEPSVPNPSAAVSAGGSNGQTGTVAEGDDSDNAGNPFDKPRNETEVNFRGVEGERAMADSKDARKMMHSLITSQFTTFFQTITMVENAAAFGLANGFNASSNLMQSIYSSATLNHQLRGRPETIQQLEFQNRIYDKLEEDKKHPNAWALGIMRATGDSFQRADDDKRFFIPEDLVAAEDPKLQTISAGEAITLEEGKDKREDTETLKLAETLLADVTPAAGESNPAPGTKDYALAYLGEIEYTKKATGPKIISTTKAVAAKKVGQKEVAEAAGTTTTVDIRGLELRTAELQKKIWDAFSVELLKKYCEFKTQDENYRQDPFNKSLPSKKVTPEILEKASSKTIKLTINLVDQIFKVYASQRPADPSKPTTINCNVFKNHQEAMPMKYEELGEGKGPDCIGAPKSCNQNKWLFRLTQMLAKDRAISEFKLTYEKLINGALSQNPIFLVKVHEYMCASLKAEGGAASDLSMCDPAVWLEALAVENRQKWVRQVEEFAKWAQNIGGASNLGFAGSNSIAQAGGNVEGMSSPPAGGGGGSE